MHCEICWAECRLKHRLKDCIHTTLVEETQIHTQVSRRKKSIRDSKSTTPHNNTGLNESETWVNISPIQHQHNDSQRQQGRRHYESAP
mmetsp:Transcript_16079/g.44262  ORF Transcript_16079/g.44262 Transcript_16079/m.44262 type:complete len:88 (-) Transcript_16079:163-426(-)